MKVNPFDDIKIENPPDREPDESVTSELVESGVVARITLERYGNKIFVVHHSRQSK